MLTEYRPLRPETINRALLNLRAQLVRDGGDELCHVDTLLRMRGCEPIPVPVKVPHRFRRNELRRAILAELRSGPLTGWQPDASKNGIFGAVAGGLRRQGGFARRT